MMVLRERELALASSLLEAGINVDLVGSRGSGRSAFLTELGRRLADQGHSVLTVQGVASLQHHVFGALQLAGVQPSGHPQSATLSATAIALRERVSAPRSVLLLDDWDDLDESSWGVLESVRRAKAVPTVLSRLQGRRARHTPSGLDASSAEPSYVLELRPLPFEQLETVVAEALNGPVEAGTMSRIYGKSGGVVGLAVSLVDAAVRDGILVLVDGYWTARRDLWSPALRGVLEVCIENLPDSARDALEIIALVGVADVNTVRKLVDWTVIELLEERALVQIVVSGPRRLVTVVPPLLVEFFRHESLVARRLRLTAYVEEQLGTDESAAVALADLGGTETNGRTADALFARLSRERTRTRQIVTRAAWQERPGPHAASDYIWSVIHDGHADELIEEVFSTTQLELGNEKARAEYTVLKTTWRAFVKHDLSGAIDDLEAAREGVGPYGRMLDAHIVYLRTYLDRVPDDFAARLEIDDDLLPDVRAYLGEVQLLVLTVLGRMTAARRVYDQLEQQPEGPSLDAQILDIHVLLGEGRVTQAHATALRGLDEAYGLLDANGVRLFGGMALVCMLISGNHAQADEVLGRVLAAGELPPLPPDASRGLQIVASILAFRRGNTVTAARLAAQASTHGDHDGPLPGQSASLTRAQEVAFEGDAATAADMLWSAHEALWKRGARYSAAFGFLAAVDACWDEERYATARSRISKLDVPLLTTQLSFLTAAHEGDADALSAVATELRAAGELGMAASAYRQAAALHRGADKAKAARALERELEDLYQTADTRVLDIARFATAAVNLTDREHEVVRLVAEGLTNPQIAAQLVLSVRTVESHLHRIMRKLGVTSRRELRRHIAASPPR